MVKFQQNDQGLKILVNELIASHIAKQMGVPTPEVAVVYVGEVFLEANPKFKTLYDAPVRPGPQFGSRCFPKYYDTIPALVAKVSNVSDFPKIVAFDVATDNHDRCGNNYDNVLLVPEDNDETLRLLSIDHGSCFGSFWSSDTLLSRIGTWCASIMPEMATEVRGRVPFADAAKDARAITESCMEDIVAAVPSEWWSSEDEREAVIRYVLGQAPNIIPILCRQRKSFPRWMPHA